MQRSLLSTIARLIRLVVCACVLLEPLLVPLHLATNEHSFGEHETTTRSATIYDHGHRQAHVHWHHDGHGDHETPHPAEEHECEAELPSTTPSDSHVDASTEPIPSGIELEPYPPAHPIARDSSNSPLRPPPRSFAAPRAPPID